MFTLLADAMFTATRTNPCDAIPECHKPYADHYIPKHERKRTQARHPHNPMRDLW